MISRITSVIFKWKHFSTGLLIALIGFVATFQVHAQVPGLVTDPIPSQVSLPCGFPQYIFCYGYLQSAPCSGNCPGNWITLSPNWPLTPLPITITATACQANKWYVSVVGERIYIPADLTKPPSATKWRTAGTQYFYGTPCNLTDWAPDYSPFNQGTCFNALYSTGPFDGVRLINGSGRIISITPYPLQTQPYFNGTNPPSYDPCQLGVYEISYTPNQADIGKMISLKLVAQLLVNSTEKGEGIRESPQAAWNLNFQVVSGSNCPSVSVAISPTSVTLSPGMAQQFSAIVTGTTNSAVTWSATGGTISSSGLYTAPTVAGTYVVKATSVVDTTKSASATINVSAPSVVIDVSPSTVTLVSGTTQQFTATVTGTTNTAVTWSTTGGTVSSSGFYTAPTVGGAYVVKATSVADTTKSGTANVTVNAPSGPAPIATAGNFMVRQGNRDRGTLPIYESGVSFEIPMGWTVTNWAICSEDGTVRTDFSQLRDFRTGQYLPIFTMYDGIPGNVTRVFGKATYSNGLIGTSNVVSVVSYWGN